jgi:hypothetical protein
VQKAWRNPLVLRVTFAGLQAPGVPWLREQSYINVPSIPPVKFTEFLRKAPGKFDARVIDEVEAALKRWLKLSKFPPTVKPEFQNCSGGRTSSWQMLGTNRIELAELAGQASHQRLLSPEPLRGNLFSRLKAGMKSKSACRKI